MLNWLKGLIEGAQMSTTDQYSRAPTQQTTIVAPVRQQQVKSVSWPARPMTALEQQLMRDAPYVEYTEEQYLKIQRDLEIDNIRATLEWLLSPAIDAFIQRETDPNEILRLMQERIIRQAELEVQLEDLQADPDLIKELQAKRAAAEEFWKKDWETNRVNGKQIVGDAQ